MLWPGINWSGSLQAAWNLRCMDTLPRDITPTRLYLHPFSKVGTLKGTCLLQVRANSQILSFKCSPFSSVMFLYKGSKPIATEQFSFEEEWKYSNKRTLPLRCILFSCMTRLILPILTLSSRTIPRQSVDIEIAPTNKAITTVTRMCLHRGGFSSFGEITFSNT